MFKSKVFIAKLSSIDGFASSAIVIGEITTLAHEVGDDTMEDTTLVTKTFFTSAESPEIFGCFRYYVFS
jgi:hypothetical protein